MELEQQQQDKGIQLPSLENLLGENYDFPQTNAADLNSQPDTTSTTDAEALVHNQREDPSLTELREAAEQPDSNYQVISNVQHRKTVDQDQHPYTQIMLPANRCLEVI